MTFRVNERLDIAALCRYSMRSSLNTQILYGRLRRESRTALLKCLTVTPGHVMPALRITGGWLP